MTEEEPTFRGFKRSDFGYDPEAFKTPPFKELDVFNLNPEEGILAEYKEFFGPDGWLERSQHVDALGGSVYPHRSRALNNGQQVDFTSAQIMFAAQRYMRGVRLPSKKQVQAVFREMAEKK